MNDVIPLRQTPPPPPPPCTPVHQEDQALPWIDTTASDLHVSLQGKNSPRINITYFQQINHIGVLRQNCCIDNDYLTALQKY